MITVIVPTDFSETANNAALYAGKMLTGNYDVELILYHIYEKDNQVENAEKTLNDLKDLLSQQSIVKIETKCDKSDDFIDSLDRLARHHSAQLIVMGISSKSKLGQVFFGSNTLKIVQKNACPVMIIPPEAQFSDKKNVALISDFKDVEKTTPVTPIKNILKLKLSNLQKASEKFWKINIMLMKCMIKSLSNLFKSHPKDSYGKFLT